MMKEMLGTRQHCRDNMTMFVGQKMFAYSIIYIHSLLLFHLDTEYFTIFQGWEFALWSFVQLACFLRAKEQMIVTLF